MDYIFNKTSWEPGFDNRPARLYLSQTILKVSKDHFLIISDHPGPIVSHLPGGNLPSPKFVHLSPPISDIYHPQKPYICQEDNCHPQFIFSSSFSGALFLAFSTYSSWRTSRMGRRRCLTRWSWSTSSRRCLTSHGAHQVEGGGGKVVLEF